MAINGGQIISHLELDTGKYTAAMASAQAQAQRFAAENATIGTKVQASLGVLSSVGRLATTGLTLPLVGAAAASSKFAISFESAFAGVRKTVDATEAQYARLNKSILEMGRAVPKSHEELSSFMETAGQLGVPQEQLQKFTRTIADLDVATNLAGQAGASMLAQYANVTGMDLSNIDRLGSVIVDLGNNTATTEMDIVSMAQRLSGMASILKLTDAQVMGLAATMASLGINAEAGGSAMSRTMQRMLQDVKKGGDSLALYAKTANMSAEAFTKLFEGDPLQAVVAFLDGLKAINDTGGDVYGVLEDLNLSDLRITETILRMSGAQGQLTTNINRANKAWQENNALTREAEQRYNTTESKIKRAQNSIKEAGISLGNAFLPVIGDAAEGVAKLANSFADMDEQSKKTLVTGAGIAAGIGPASLLIKGLIGLFTGPGGLVVALSVAGVAIAGLNKLNKEMTFAELGKEMGDIKLSADEIKAIVDQGFGKPLIDMESITKASDEADAAKVKFEELQNQLSKDVYLAKLGVKKFTAEEAASQVSGLVASANEYLAKEENAARMTVTAYFGSADSSAAQGMLGDLDAAFAPMKQELANKGKELGDAFKNAISDGVIDEEEARVIANLQNEISLIKARAAMTELQTERDVAIAKAQHGGLNVDSMRELNASIKEEEQKRQQNNELLRDANLKIAANSKNYGIISEDEYQQRVQTIMGQYGFLDANNEMAAFDTSYQGYGRQMIDVFAPKLAMVKDMIQKWGTNMNVVGHGDQEEYLDKDSVNSAVQQAAVFMDEFGEIFGSLQKMKETMGDDMPAQYAEMYEAYYQINALANNKFDQLKGANDLDVNKIDAEIEAAEAARKKLEESLKEIRETAPQEGAEAGAAVITSANESAQSQEVTVDDAVLNPLNDLPGEMGRIGTNAAVTLANSVSAQADAAYASGGIIGNAVERGAKDALQIASPSKRMQAIADISIWSLNDRLEAGMPSTYQISKKAGTAIYQGEEDGYREAVKAGRTYIPLDKDPVPGVRTAGGGLPKGAVLRSAIDKSIEKNTKPRTGGGGGSKAAPAPIDYSAGIYQTMDQVQQHQEALQWMNMVADSERERLLALSGDWRAYYDKTQMDQMVEAVQDKYRRLMDAEQAGFAALTQEEQQARSQAHSQLMQQLQQNQNAEISRLKENYDLQRRLATDFLSAQAAALQDAFAQKQEAARAEDYEQNIAELEKRIRQSRSARERRELTEELERMRRDEALRLEQEALNQALRGIEGLKGAVASGVIGLGDLTGDRSLPASAFGAGLSKVQGITAEQLERALTAIADRQESQAQAGNHYSIDLSGAVIRDDSDIDRIVAAFEERSRSIQRDINVWR